MKLDEEVGRLSTALFAQQQQISSEKRALENVRHSILQMQSQAPNQHASKVISANFQLQGQNAFLQAKVVSLQTKLEKYKQKLKAANEKLMELLQQKKTFGFTVGNNNNNNNQLMGNDGSQIDPNILYTQSRANYNFNRIDGLPRVNVRNGVESEMNLANRERKNMLGSGNLGSVIGGGRMDLNDYGPGKFSKTYVGVSGGRDFGDRDWRFQSDRKVLGGANRGNHNLRNSACKFLLYYKYKENNFLIDLYGFI